MFCLVVFSKCRDVHVKCTGYCWCCLS